MRRWSLGSKSCKLSTTTSLLHIHERRRPEDQPGRYATPVCAGRMDSRCCLIRSVIPHAAMKRLSFTIHCNPNTKYLRQDDPYLQARFIPCRYACLPKLNTWWMNWYHTIIFRIAKKVTVSLDAPWLHKCSRSILWLNMVVAVRVDGIICDVRLEVEYFSNTLQAIQH